LDYHDVNFEPRNHDCTQQVQYEKFKLFTKVQYINIHVDFSLHITHVYNPMKTHTIYHERNKKGKKQIINHNSKSTIEVHCTKPHQANREPWRNISFHSS
jgi:hypothetical protein